MTRSTILFILSCFVSIMSSSQVNQKYIGRSGRAEQATAFTTLNNGNKIIVGFAWTGASSAGSEAFITCIDPADNIVWSKEVGTANTDRFLSVCKTVDGGCVAVGLVNENNSNPYAGNIGCMYKFDAAGNVLWYKLLSLTSAGEYLQTVIEIPGSGHIVAIGSYNFIAGSINSLVVDYDASGNLLWNKVFDKTGTDEGYGVTYANGRVYCTGVWQGLSYFDGYLMALNEANGNVVWTKSFDFTSLTSSYACNWPIHLNQVGANLYIDANITPDYSGSPAKPTIISFDTLGASPLCLEYPITGTTVGMISSKVVSASEIYLVQNAGTGTISWNGGLGGTSLTTMYDGVITKITSLTASPANILYTRKMGSTGEQAITGIDVVSNRLVGVGCERNDPTHEIGGNDVFKLDADPSLPVTSTNCVTNVTGQQLANPIVAVNNSFTFDNITTPAFPPPAVVPAITSVTISTNSPCQAGDTIINKYAAVLSRGTCDNTLEVDDATSFNVGDTVLMIQMKGADVDTTNTAAFGNILNYNGAGNYELNVIKAKTGNTLTLKYKIVRTYNIPNGRVQLVRVPYYQNYTVNQPHTCLPWTGTKGGVFIMNVAGTLTLNNKIDVSGRGFTGGQINNGATYTCDMPDYFYPSSGNDGGIKAEGITEISAAKMRGRGKLANGGGGGNSTNAGGAGGGNGGTGGDGGHQWGGCNTTLLLGGIPGAALGYTPAANKLFMGGGGGCGHENNGDTDPGGNGGGIVLINAASLAGNSLFIRSNGDDCIDNFSLPPANGDGQSGGGAGGAIYLKVTTFISNPNIEAKGGNGGSIHIAALHGPGGGGGGGAVVFSGATLPASTINTAPGISGTVIGLSTSHFATGGQAGITVNNFPYISPIDTFKINVLHADFIDSVAGCVIRKFKDQSTFTSTGIATWSWDFGGSNTSALQNPTFTFAGAGTYPVKLVITDSNGCKDSITKNVVIVVPHFANAGPDALVCAGTPATLTASGGTIYSWSPAAGLSNTNTATTTATVAATTQYIVTVTNGAGCIDQDTVLVNIRPAAPVVASPHSYTGCKGRVVQLNATGAVSYSWSPAGGLSSTTIANPTVTINTGTAHYIVTGIDSYGCKGYDSVDVIEGGSIIIDATSDGTGISCYHRTVQLHATGALSYRWHPGAYCNDSTIPSPTVNPTVTTTFTVTGTDADGCIGEDTITVISYGDYSVYIPNAFTPNGDGTNDDIKPMVFCGFQFEEFLVFNRWGQNVFSSKSLNIGWDGDFNGGKAELGVYHYLIKGKKDNGEPVLLKGNFTLLR